MRPSFSFLFLHGFVVLLLVFASACGKKSGADVNIQAEISNLASDNAETRQNACVKLGEAKEAASAGVKPLMAALKDKDALVRRLAAYALGEIGAKAKEAIPALRDAMKDPDPSVASSAASAITAIDPSQKVESLGPNVTN
ncbi:MAG: HEAT repeat domain-containing protein [Verrucomicrobia bacterium]|nr:HEAT repeat domain-containing protein [Verrucomicrobiota bacterium]